MRVILKGVNTRRAALADGRRVTYHYLGKGGPRIYGEPGTPEFMASYIQATQSRREPSEKTLGDLLRDFIASTDFQLKRDRTKRDYLSKIELIDVKFGALSLKSLCEPETRDVFLTWRDELSQSSIRQAEYTLVILASILSWAKQRQKIPSNPLEKIGRIYSGTRVEAVWTDADEAAFNRVASPNIKLALMLALWTGQRQGDLLRLTWRDYDGLWIRLQQSKTNVRLQIPVSRALKQALDEAKRSSPAILTNADGRPWNPDGFRSSWRKTCKKAGISGLTFNDLRGTAVTRLALAGCSEPEIAAITGHTLRNVKSILEKHYLKRDPQLALNAIAKLERRITAPEHSPQWAVQPTA
jgi:integrase